MSLSLRYRRVKELSRWFLSPLLYHSGDCYQQYGKSLSSVPFSYKSIANGSLVTAFHQHRFSTLANVSREHAPEVDLLSFIKSSLDELEGPHHYWLNRSVKNKQFFGIDGVHGIFLVLAARNFECGIMFQKLKAIQERFPHVTIMGIKLTNSSDRENLIQLLMTENITFPILLTQRTFPQIEKGACYILFKSFKSPIICHEKDVSLEVIYQAIQGLQKQPSDDSKLLNVLRSTSWKQDLITKDQYIYSPLQNLLLYYPDCVSADESNNRLFISDCNHHRIIVCDDNGKIIDCVGSSPGFEDGDFESAKLRRPAGSYYHAIKNCLYFLDSENHAIRRADMGARIVETLYPISTVNGGSGRIRNWIRSKLGLESSVETIEEEKPEVFDSKSLYFPWHLLKSDDDTLYIIDRRFQTLWTVDFGSGKVDEVFEGSPRIIEICRQLIGQNLSILDKIPCNQFQQKTNNVCVLDGLPHSDLLSSSTTLQNHVFICDKGRQRITKINIESGACLDFQLSNLGLLGFPYWLTSPVEIFYAGGNGLSDTAIDHLQHFDLLPGKIDIHLSVDVPADIELVEPLQDSCIWRQARGAATEISGMDDPSSIDKVGVAQQWYDELDYIAAPKPEHEIPKDDNLDKNIVVEDDDKIHINSSVCTSPGTSEVVIFAALYCKLKKIPNTNDGNQEKYAARILDFLSSKRSGKSERDSWNAFLLQSKGDLRDLIFTKLLHARVRLNTFDHPKAENQRDFILTDSSIKVNVLLN
ncbi:haloacid dehalogenase hydrolase family protein [Trifolium repens]|nr:haloacid dehalogenase hydrolase family protein [Trifolium repens]